MLNEEQITKVLWQINQRGDEPKYSANDIIYEPEPVESVEPCYFIHINDYRNPDFPYVNLGRFDAYKKQWLATCVTSTVGMYEYERQEFYEVEVHNVVGYIHYKQ